MTPNPGSEEARARGCTCPVMDNAYGKGYMGGVKDDFGNTVFVYTEECEVHSPFILDAPEPVTTEQ